jgi:hypothetical protein
MDHNGGGITKNMDFVVPIKKMGLFTRAVLEGISLFYQPRRIIVVIQKDEVALLQKEIIHWKTASIVILDESVYFEKNFGLNMNQLEKEFQSTNDEKHREFGWWYQQMIKLGACNQIEDITEHYVVWDGDLIPLQKWDLVQKNTQGTADYYIAILQNEPRSEFNKEEYKKCIQHLLGFPSFAPPNYGTFVTHHMIFHKERVKEMLQFILDRNNILKSWPIYFLSLSHQFYRFSEYMLYSSFLTRFHPDQFFYYPYEYYGKTGLRFREPEEIIKELCFSYPYKTDRCFSYHEIAEFFRIKTEYPSYVQFEHVYYLL